MKRLHIFLIILLGYAHGFGGLGVTAGNNTINNPEGSFNLVQDGINIGSTNYEEFKGANSIGAYFYLDSAIPFIDIDLEANLKIATYKYNFNNEIGAFPGEFAWLSSSLYLTGQKNIFKLSIPFLAKAKIFAGAGVNSHSSTPIINQELLKVAMNGDLNSEFNEDSVIEYFRENNISKNGFHIQGGLQFKLLVFDSLLIFRQVFTDGITSDTKAFSNVNLRLGLGL